LQIQQILNVQGSEFPEDCSLREGAQESGELRIAIERTYLLNIDQGMPTTELFDFSQQDQTFSTKDVVEGIDRAIELIEVYTCSGVHKMNALFDTGMEPNMICRTMAEARELVLDNYSGPQVQTADGRSFMSEGQVVIHFSFPNGGRAKSYRVDAPENAPFDVALGIHFIQRAQVFIKNPAGYVLHSVKETTGTGSVSTFALLFLANLRYSEQTAAREKKEKETKGYNELIEAQRADDSRRKRQEQRLKTTTASSASTSPSTDYSAGSGRSAGRSGSGASKSTG